MGLNIVAQDKIVLNSGSQIEAVIVEITDTKIKYRKFDNQEGPIYSVDKQTIKEINYSDGKHELFNENAAETQYDINQQPLTYKHRKLYYQGEKIPKKDVKTLYADCPEALSAYNRSKLFNGLSWGFLVADLAYIVYDISSGYEATLGSIFIMGSLLGSSIAFSFMSQGQFNNSVGIFNKANQNPQSSSSINLNLAFTPNGIGLVLRF